MPSNSTSDTSNTLEILSPTKVSYKIDTDTGETVSGDIYTISPDKLTAAYKAISTKFNKEKITNLCLQIQ
jgi:hypothetical protein